MTKFATIILNRNLPNITDKLYRRIKKDNDTDIFVVESGSKKKNYSKYATWVADWQSAKKNGLRFPRGMNFGLSNLWKENKFEKYEFFLLLANDAEIKSKDCLKKFERIFNKHPRIGFLSGCSSNWGEKLLLKKNKTMYFWHMENHAIAIRKDFVLDIMNTKNPGYMNFLYDGSNFRGYGTESELIVKAYSNFWSTAITSEIEINENQSHLINKSDLIETENYDKNLKLYIKEGQEWMKKKYGFKSKWSMQMYAKNFYDKFFEYYPEYRKYRL